MPATMVPPAALKISRLTVKAVSQMAQSKNPFTGQRQFLKWPGDHWEFGITLPPMTRADAGAVIGFLLNAQMRGETIEFGPVGPEATPKGSALGTPVTNITPGATNPITGNPDTGLEDYGLRTDGWTPNQDGVLKAGDWIQYGDQLCMMQMDANANASGVATLFAWPAPRLPFPDDGVSIITSNPKGVFRLGEFTTPWDLNTAQHYGLGFTLIEDF